MVIYTVILITSLTVQAWGLKLCVRDREYEQGAPLLLLSYMLLLIRVILQTSEGWLWL